MANSAPRVLALILCDQAFQQLGNGKWCVMGSFGVVNVRALPIEFSPLAVWVSLADFPGDAFVTVVIRDPDGAVVYAMRAQVPALPSSCFDIAFPFPPIPLKRAGSHSLELEVGGKLLALRSFAVRVMDAQAQPSGA